MKDNTTYI